MMTMSQLSTDHHHEMHQELDKLHMLKHMRKTSPDLWNQAVDLYMNEIVSVHIPLAQCPHCGQELPEPEDSSS